MPSKQFRPQGKATEGRMLASVAPKRCWRPQAAEEVAESRGRERCWCVAILSCL
jgi:hypothetical protein